MQAIDFHRGIPLFPLPNCVLFPGAALPLHIFEERYRAMIADALNCQGVIAMALLKPGWEKDYYGFPEIHATVCVGKIVTHEKLADGKYNLLLQGVARAVVERECREKYRSGMLRPLRDHIPHDVGDALCDCRNRLRALFRETPLGRLSTAPAVLEMLDGSLSIWNIVDVLAFSMLREPCEKQRILEEPDVVKRGDLLIARLEDLARLPAEIGRCERRPIKNVFQWPPSMN